MAQDVPQGRPPVEWVEDLFARIAAIVGAQALEAMCAGVDPALVKAEWAKGLTGLSRAEVARGLAATRLRKFPPNLPEFLHLCRPALDPEFAWHEAVEGMREWAGGNAFAWSHPAVFWAAMTMREELRAKPYAECRVAWSRRMAQQWSQLVGWDPIPEPPQRLERSDWVNDPRVVDVARQRLERVRQAVLLRRQPLAAEFSE